MRSHSGKEEVTDHYKTAYFLAFIAVLAPMATWVLALSLSIASRFIADAWSSSVALLFVPLVLVNSMSVPLLLFSMTIFWQPHKYPALLLMRIAGVANVVVYSCTGG